MFRSLAVFAAAAAALAPGSLPQGSEPVTLDPADFTVRIDHPYWPMRPGDRWVYREGRERIVTTVTNRTRKIANGVTRAWCTTSRGAAGAVIEDTFDWYAQDREGNLWYLGEDTRELRRGRVVSREGSWEAGIKGAQPGIILPAHPAVGQEYRQEYFKGHAEDRARILSVDEQAEVPYGHFSRVVMTRDWTPLEPRLLEHKFYARGVGPVLEVTVSGGSGRVSLVDRSS